MTKTDALEIPVEFGGVSIGETTARLGLKISRDFLKIQQADEVFCGHRLTGSVVLGGKDDQPGQEKFWDSDHKVDATFDVKRIGLSADQISTGLTFSLADIDIGELAKFSKGSGKLIIADVGEIPEDVKEESHSGNEAPGTLKAEGPWRDEPIDNLFKPGVILASLKNAGLNTLGELSDYTASERLLTDLNGIGPGKAEQIENRLVEFWEQNQDYAEV